MEYIHALYEYDCARKLHSPYTQQIQYVFKDSRGAYMASTLMTPFKKYWGAKMQNDGAYFSEDQARFYAAELLLAVEEAHSKNIAHRDVRMDNLLLDQDGHLILADFGAAWDKARGDVLRQPWR